MKQLISKIFRPFKTNNVESNDSFQELGLQVPYWDMSKVAEGLKSSFVNTPTGTALVLQDGAYDIDLSIIWIPRTVDKENEMCQMDAHGVLLLHHGQKVREWNDMDEYEGINYRHIQNVINTLVEKDIKEVRQSGKDLDNPYVKYWLTGHMIQAAVVPVPTF